MPKRVIISRLALSLALAGGAAALSGCSSLSEALGTTKAPPDEFAILTAAPLIVPPDYNLRPPEPGAPSRNQQDPSAQARSALYTQSSLAGDSGSSYSDAEKALLARSGAANVDPSIRRTLSTETGYDSNDPALTDRVLSGGGGGGAAAPAPAPAPAAAAAPASAEPAAPTEPAPDAPQPAPSGQ